MQKFRAVSKIWKSSEFTENIQKFVKLSKNTNSIQMDVEIIDKHRDIRDTLPELSEIIMSAITIDSVVNIVNYIALITINDGFSIVIDASNDSISIVSKPRHDFYYDAHCILSNPKGNLIENICAELGIFSNGGGTSVEFPGGTSTNLYKQDMLEYCHECGFYIEVTTQRLGGGKIKFIIHGIPGSQKDAKIIFERIKSAYHCDHGFCTCS